MEIRIEDIRTPPVPRVADDGQPFVVTKRTNEQRQTDCGEILGPDRYKQVVAGHVGSGSQH